jgi:hypothetical protein
MEAGQIGPKPYRPEVKLAPSQNYWRIKTVIFNKSRQNGIGNMVFGNLVLIPSKYSWVLYQ